MEPEYVGFCRGCNGFSEHLCIRPVINNNSEHLEVSLFCPDCRKRFGLYPYHKEQMADPKDCSGHVEWKVTE